MNEDQVLRAEDEADIEENEEFDSQEDEFYKVHNDKVEIDMVLDMNDNEIMRMDEFQYFKDVLTHLNQQNPEFLKS